jgi:hypothetical protein
MTFDVRTCILVAAAGVALSLLLMRLLPAPPPEEAMYARIQWWEANVACLAQMHRTGRAETSCPHSPPGSEKPPGQ